jgi:hypothetical protein
MYKVASDRRQKVLHQGTPRDWVNGTEQLSSEEQLRQLKEGLSILEDRIKNAGRSEKKELGLRKLAMQTEISELRQRAHLRRQAIRGFEETFIDCARTMLAPLQFKLISAAAMTEVKRRIAEHETAEAQNKTTVG